jgi:uncharacterized protein with ATP-grasp and redox domains
MLDLLNDEPRRMREAEVVISKGIGNSESLYGRAERRSTLSSWSSAPCRTDGRATGRLRLIWRWQPER